MLVTRVRPLLLAFLCLASTASMFGQGITTGSITGSVQDAQGAVVTNATVTAVNTQTNVASTAQTNAQGEFQIRSLPVGTYEVQIKAAGFETLAVEDIAVNAGQPSTVGRQTLGVAGTAQNIQVGGESALLQTDPMQTSATFETKSLEDLPLGGGGLDVVALYTPGISTAGDLGGLSGGSGATFAANGQRERQANYEIDGQSNNDTSVATPILFLTDQDAFQEIQVFTNYSAEYGRTTGPVINYITKQGTNQLHGSAFEYYNGDWGDSLTNQSKSPLFGNCPSGVAAGTGGCTTPFVPRLVDNRFGGAVGGPILRDKLWFFGSGNFDIDRPGPSPSGSGGLLTPTPAGISTLDGCFPGDSAVSFLKKFGPATVPGTLTYGPTTLTTIGTCAGVAEAPVTRSLATTPVIPAHDYESIGRVDWQITDKDRVFGRYIFQQELFQNFPGINGIAAGDFINEPLRNQAVGVDYTRTFSSSFLNQVRYSYGRENSAFEGGDYPNCTRANYTECPTSIGFTDNTLPLGLDILFPQGRFVLDHQVQDNASFMHGRHYFKWGGEFHRQSQPNFFLPFVNGLYTYASLSDFILDNQVGGPPAGTASAFLDLANGPPQINFNENQFAAYFQDDWKALSNLTITLGLRYDLFGQAVNTLHDETVARESNPATAFWDTTLPLSQRTVPSQPLNTKNFGPVIGFAYNPQFPWLGHDSTVLRGGFRISYNPAFYNLFTNVGGAAPTVNLGFNIPCNECLPAAATGGAVTAQNLSLLPIHGNPGLANEELLPTQLLSPYTEQWQLSLEHEFGPQIVAEVRYVGNHGVHLFQTQDGNPDVGPLYDNGFASDVPSSITPCSDSTKIGYALGFVNCNLTASYLTSNAGYSFYDGLQTRLDFRGWHGLTGGATYTFSKTIDNTTEVYATGNGGNTSEFSQNPFVPNERGLSGIDFPNELAIYLLYTPPFFQGRNDWVGKVFGGWELSPTYRYTSGQLYSVLQNDPGWEGFGAVVAGQYTVPDSATGSLCNPNGLFGNDICRPILSNAAAPFGTVGVYCNPGSVYNPATLTFVPVDPTCPGPGTLYAYNPSSPSGHSGPAISPSSVHWIYNDVNAGAVYGTAFAGAPRNIARGDSVNTVNMSLMKEVTFRERYSLQMRVTAYNVLNRMFLGTPGVNISNPATFGNTFYNVSGGGSNQINSVYQGLAQRHFELSARITF